MGVINLAIKLKKLITKVNKIGKDVDSLEMKEYSWKGLSPSTDLATYNEIKSRCISGLPVRIYYEDSNLRKYTFDGFYYDVDSQGTMKIYGFSGKDRFALRFTLFDEDVDIDLVTFS